MSDDNKRLTKGFPPITTEEPKCSDHGPTLRDYFTPNGMTLRDYFAAKAMQALMMPNWDGSIVEVVEDAYRIADLMMQERDK